MNIYSVSTEQLEAELQKPDGQRTWSANTIKNQLAARRVETMRLAFALDDLQDTPSGIQAVLDRLGPFQVGESNYLARHRAKTERRLVALLGLDAPFELRQRHGVNGKKRVKNTLSDQYDEVGPFVRGEPLETTRKRAAIERRMLKRGVVPRNAIVLAALVRRAEIVATEKQAKEAFRKRSNQ